ncbi:hypothetical protein [Pseudomonas gessardii]|uniref:hypothetical protein n=1 Tax=Pseudomonas gessardii TaxID=78544 RepID=UPI001474BCFA|nr:hypothetical protein [Pseudomonas gessardii]NNA92841.1 hypothetical protein [Pseudomonas gessardii]
MAIEDTKKLKVTTTLHYANALLDAGWTLIGSQDLVIEGDALTRYTLGWQKDGEPAHVDQTQW